MRARASGHRAAPRGTDAAQAPSLPGEPYRSAAPPPEQGAQQHRAIAQLQARVALHTRRREEAERAAAAAQRDALRLGAELDRAREHARRLGAELGALEAHLLGSLDGGGVLDPAAPLRARRMLYVGGRPGSNAAIRAIAARWGISVTMHDAAIGRREASLSAAISGADLVLFPLDCFDRDSAAELERRCACRGLPCHALRSAGVASFVATVMQLDASGHARVQRAAASRLCLRHG